MNNVYLRRNWNWQACDAQNQIKEWRIISKMKIGAMVLFIQAFRFMRQMVRCTNCMFHILHEVGAERKASQQHTITLHNPCGYWIPSSNNKWLSVSLGSMNWNHALGPHHKWAMAMTMNPKTVPRHFQDHVTWSRAHKCSVKSFVTRPSTKCYCNEFLRM